MNRREFIAGASVLGILGATGTSAAISAGMPVVAQSRLKQLWAAWGEIKDRLPKEASDELISRSYQMTFQRVMGASLPAIVRNDDGYDVIAHLPARDEHFEPAVLSAVYKFTPEMMAAYKITENPVVHVPLLTQEQRQYRITKHWQNHA